MKKHLLMLLLLCTLSAAAQAQDVVLAHDHGIVVDISHYITTNKPITCLTGVFRGNFRRSTPSPPLAPLTSIVIPERETFIRGEAFFSCYHLTNVVIPNSVTDIGLDAFANCYSLRSITIPANVTRIGGRAFENCYNLDQVYFIGNCPQLGDYAFFAAPNATIYYLPGTKGWGKTFGGRPTAEWKP